MTMRRFWRRLPVVGALLLLATTAVPVAATTTPPAAETTGRGSITVVKDAVPNAATNFSYATTGAGVPRSFALDDDANPALPRTRTFRNLATGTYTFREAAVTGWALTRLVCSRPETVNLTQRKVTIRLTAGENVRCTFTNSRRGSITIRKEVLGAVETHLATDFDFTTTGTGVSDFQLDDDQGFDPTLPDTRTFSNLVPGAYRFVEEAEPGYFLTDLACTTTERPQLLQRQVDITLAAGEHVTCTFENATLGASTGSLQVVKLRSADGPLTDFEFTVTGPGTFTDGFSLTPAAAWVGADWATLPDLKPGDYQVTELVPTGWDLTGIDCNAPAMMVGSTATVEVAVGHNTICTFGNQPTGATPAPATLTVVKDTRPNDATEFQFTSTANPGYTNFGLADGQSVTFPVTPGRLYDIEELPMVGWALQSASCNRGVWWRWQDVVLFWAAPGQRITCTFVNETAGSVTIRKVAEPTDDSLFHFDDWGDRYSLGEGDSFTLDDGSEETFTNVAPGDYVVRERPEPGWVMSDVACTGGPGPAVVDHYRGVFEFDVGPGDDVVCTVTNVLVGHLTIRKDARPDDEQLFRFSSRTIPGLSPFPLSDGGIEANQVTLDVVPGVPTDVYELVPEGWTLSDAACDAGDWSFSTADHAVTVTLLPDQAATCTFVNTAPGAPGSITIVEDSRPDGPQDFFFTPDWTTGFSLDDDADPEHEDRVTFDGLAAGQYSISQAWVDDWHLTDIACTGGSLTSGHPFGRTLYVTLAEGEAVVCTFVNDGAAITVDLELSGAFVLEDSVGFSLTTEDAEIWTLAGSDCRPGDPCTMVYGGVNPDPGPRTFRALPPGTYTLAATGADGYLTRTADVTCTAGGTGDPVTYRAQVLLAPGAEVTCTFALDARWEGEYGPTVEWSSGTIEVFTFEYEVAGATTWTTTASCTQVPAGGYLCDFPDLIDLQPGTWTLTETSTDPETTFDGVECASLLGTPTSTTFSPDVAGRSVEIHVEGQDTIQCEFQHTEIT